MSQTDEQLYQDTQTLIEIWDKLTEVRQAQIPPLDLLELSFRTELSERELEDYFNNYADVKIKTLLKIARAAGKTVKIDIE